MADGSTGDAADASGALPERSVLTLDEYLAMQAALGHRLRFRVVRALADEERRPGDLADDLDVASNTLHYHLRALVDVGLVERRKGARPDDNRLHSFYRATPMATTLLGDGVEALLRSERAILATYSE